MAVPRDWMAKTLKAHNDLRARHGARPLQWSDECCEAAQVQANACQSRGALFHGNLEGRSGRHGQNAFGGSGGERFDAGDVVQMWYDEVAEYNFRRPGFAQGTGHFTQVVWADTTHVGMARSADGRYVIANYFPSGNYSGCFEQNVRPAGSEAAAKPVHHRHHDDHDKQHYHQHHHHDGDHEHHDYDQQRHHHDSDQQRRHHRGAQQHRHGDDDGDQQHHQHDRPGGGRVLLGAGGAQAGKVHLGTVKANGWTPEVQAALEGVPSPEARSRVQRGLSEGAAVTIERQAQSISVTTEKAGATRRWNMQWG